MTAERIAKLRVEATEPSGIKMPRKSLMECLDAIEQLQSDKDRLVQEVYRLNSMMNGTKAKTTPPLDGEAKP